MKVFMALYPAAARHITAPAFNKIFRPDKNAAITFGDTFDEIIYQLKVWKRKNIKYYW